MWWEKERVPLPAYIEDVLWWAQNTSESALPQPAIWYGHEDEHDEHGSTGPLPPDDWVDPTILLVCYRNDTGCWVLFLRTDGRPVVGIDRNTHDRVDLRFPSLSAARRFIEWASGLVLDYAAANVEELLAYGGSATVFEQRVRAY